GAEGEKIAVKLAFGKVTEPGFEAGVERLDDPKALEQFAVVGKSNDDQTVENSLHDAAELVQIGLALGEDGLVARIAFQDVLGQTFAPSLEPFQETPVHVLLRLNRRKVFQAFVFEAGAAQPHEVTE